MNENGWHWTYYIFRERGWNGNVGAALLVGAFAARAHARATWFESRQADQPGDAADGAPRRP